MGYRQRKRAIGETWIRDWGGKVAIRAGRINDRAGKVAIPGDTDRGSRRQGGDSWRHGSAIAQARWRSMETRIRDRVGEGRFMETWIRNRAGKMAIRGGVGRDRFMDRASDLGKRPLTRSYRQRGKHVQGQREPNRRLMLLWLIMLK